MGISIESTLELSIALTASGTVVFFPSGDDYIDYGHVLVYSSDIDVYWYAGNDLSAVRTTGVQQKDVTVDTVTSAATYTATLDGTAFNHVATVIDTKATIAASLVALINANGDFDAYAVGADGFSVVLKDGTAFTSATVSALMTVTDGPSATSPSVPSGREMPVCLNLQRALALKGSGTGTVKVKLFRDKQVDMRGPYPQPVTDLTVTY